MKTKTNLLMLLALFSLNSVVFADSPLTSTPFSDAYQNEPIIIKASKTNGLLTIDLMDYLADESKPIALKMALINKLRWNIDGKSNASTFFDYLKKKNSYTSEDDFMKNGNGDELLSMAYLKAMDNYFDVDDAIRYADNALKKNSKSYTYNILTAIIKAQKAMGGDWCEVYKLTDNVRMNTSLNRDMKNEAITIIFEYMDFYKDDCK